MTGFGAFSDGCCGIFGSIFASPWTTVMPHTTVRGGAGGVGGSGTNCGADVGEGGAGGVTFS